MAENISAVLEFTVGRTGILSDVQPRKTTATAANRYKRLDTKPEFSALEDFVI